MKYEQRNAFNSHFEQSKKIEKNKEVCSMKISFTVTFLYFFTCVRTSMCESPPPLLLVHKRTLLIELPLSQFMSKYYANAPSRKTQVLEI